MQVRNQQTPDSGRLEPGQGPSDVFDLAGTLKRLGGDRGLLSDLIKMFLEDSPGLFDRMAGGLASKRCSQIQHAAHALRGLASNFGASALIRTLQAIEDSANQGKLDDLPGLIEQAQSEDSRLKIALRTC